MLPRSMDAPRKAALLVRNKAAVKVLVPSRQKTRTGLPCVEAAIRDVIEANRIHLSPIHIGLVMV